MTEPRTARAIEDTLRIEGLDLAYRVRGRDRAVIRDLSLRIGRGESYGLVGESGCGKSTLAFAVMRYLAENGRVSKGRILVSGTDIMAAGPAELRRLRSGTLSMVYQDPGKALNPSLVVGRQLREVFEIAGLSSKAAAAAALDMLERVRIVDPAGVMERYPHQLSGGMQQRVCIAMALAVKPALLILDEPTTGLDVTVEAEVLDLVAELRREFDTAILFISHNLAVVSRMCERVGVLYAGALVEEGRTREVFQNPRHPYTRALLRCLPERGMRKSAGRLETIPGGLPGTGIALPGCLFEPRCAYAAPPCRTAAPGLEPAGDHLARCHFRNELPPLAPLPPAEAGGASCDYEAPPALSLRDVAKTFQAGAKTIKALREVSFDLWPGETLGIVGESGSGKSTLARVLLGLYTPDAGGTVTLHGEPLAGAVEERSAAQVKNVQIVFQNPDVALNRAHTVRRIVGRALFKLAGLSGAARRARLLELAASVRLSPREIDVKPRRLSGGLKQRVSIARAFAGQPSVVVCDEPTSALDVSVQAAILNLLVDLQAKNGTSYIFISHDLAVVQYISDRILVLYRGEIVEIGSVADVLSGPNHPYTKTLLSAVVKGDAGLPVPAPGRPEASTGCVLGSRCPERGGAACDGGAGLTEVSPRHFIRCPRAAVVPAGAEVGPSASAG